MPDIISGAIATMAGVGLFGAVNSYINQPSAPDIPAPPAPANYYSYNDDGSVTVQRWDASQNAYITEYDPEPKNTNSEAWQKWKERKDKKDTKQAQLDKLEKEMTDNLSKPPEDRIKAYDEYAANYSKSMHLDVDEQYGKNIQAAGEQMAARGLLGSSAYADTMRNLGEEKTKADTDIATQAQLQKENLMETDRNYWLNVLNYVQNYKNADYAQQLNEANKVSQGVQLGNAALLGRYSASTLPIMQEWQGRIAQNAANTKTMTDTASGLMFLYGMKNSGFGLGTTKPANTGNSYGSSPSMINRMRGTYLNSLYL